MAGEGQGAAGAASSGAEQYLQDKYGSKDAHVFFTREQCDELLDRVLSTSKTVQFLIESLKQNGCAIGRGFFHVTKCGLDVGASFSTEDGVVLCHNRLMHYREVELAVAHELIHAYDFCRAGNMDLTDCRHHACTEIRAANLSGDCTAMQEFLRGNLWDALIGQHKRCVRRRALLSVSMNPYCQDGKAEAAVNEMMGACLRDTDPFARTPS